MSAFCREHRLVPSTLAYWRRRLAALPGPDAGPSAPPSMAVSFVALEQAPDAPVSPLELVVDGGRVIRVFSGFDSSTLLRLVDVLEGGV